MSDDKTFIYQPDNEAGEFMMLIAREEELTVDGRIFDAGAIEWREPPIPLMATRVNGEAGGHKGSVAAGAITDIFRDGGSIYGRGYFASDEHGQAVKQMISEGVISRVSADVGGAVVEDFGDAGSDGVRKRIKKGTIIAVTALPMSSFHDTNISVTAAATPDNWQPPAEWFRSPQLDGPTPLTVTADGRIYGHAAIWGTCHVGHKDRCVTPPRSSSNYQFFNTGVVLTADGSTVTVGRLTAGTGHAALEFGAQPAVDHYDNNGWGAAYVHATEDEYGIVFAGAVSPEATADQIAALRAGAVSGDWRSINRSLEMVGLLAVNIPGFPVPRAQAGFVASAQNSLVAAGVVTDDCNCADCPKSEDLASEEEGAFKAHYDKDGKKVEDEDFAGHKDKDEDEEMGMKPKKDEDEDFRGMKKKVKELFSAALDELIAEKFAPTEEVSDVEVPETTEGEFVSELPTQETVETINLDALDTEIMDFDVDRLGRQLG